MTTETTIHGHRSPWFGRSVVRALALLAVLIGLAVLATPPPERADAQTATTFVSTTGQTSFSSASFASTTGRYAQQFETGSNSSNSDYSLSEIVVKIHTAVSSATPSFALHNSTTQGTLDVPGTKIVDLSGSSWYCRRPKLHPCQHHDA